MTSDFSISNATIILQCNAILKPKWTYRHTAGVLPGSQIGNSTKFPKQSAPFLSQRSLERSKQAYA